MQAAPTLGGTQRVITAENKKSSVFDKICHYCSNPEWPAIQRSCAKHGRKPYIYNWNTTKANYVGSDGMSFVAGVLEDIDRHPMKNPEHPKAKTYRCGMIVAFLMFFILGVVGIEGTDGGSSQSTFVVFYLILIALFVFCVVWRVGFMMKDYQCRRSEEMLEIFRRKELVAPHVKFRLMNRGWSLLAEVQEHGHIAHPDEIRFNQQPNSANRFALKDPSSHQERLPPGFLDHKPKRSTDEVNIKDQMGADHKKFGLREQGEKPAQASKARDQDLTDEEKDNPYGDFDKFE